MGYLILPAPGTKLGPCSAACEHRDCKANRETAESICPFCNKAVGYETEFEYIAQGSTAGQHFWCAVEAAEKKS